MANSDLPTAMPAIRSEGQAPGAIEPSRSASSRDDAAAGAEEAATPPSGGAAAGARTLRDVMAEKAALSEAMHGKIKVRRFRGNFDGMSAGRAVGWALDELEAKTRLLIEVWDGERFIAVGEASKRRDDLVQAGVGDGHCHFAIDLPATIADGAEHHLTARVSGSDHVLAGAVTFRSERNRISGALEQLDGLTLRGWISSTAGEWMIVEIYCDGVNFGSVEVPALTPDQRYALVWGLPVACADGNVHWFQAKVRATGKIVAETVLVTPTIATPESALQTYAKDFPAFMSSSAADRYTSLVEQMKYFQVFISKQSPRSRPSTAAEYFNQIALAHAQVKIGIKDQNKSPEGLRFPSYDAPDVSIVVPAHNKFWVTYNCLAALLLAPNRNTFEVIVVDDGSSDMTKDLASYVSGITVLRNETAEGFVKSSNRGGSQARGDFVVMLNNDTEPCAHWIDELVHVFDNFADVGLAGAKFVYPNGALQEAGGIVFPNFDIWNYGRNGNPAEPRFNYTRQADYISGACIMLRRSLWRELGGFDEFFAPAYYEDTDLAFRVRKAGLKTYYAPFSKIVHFEGISSGTSVTSGIKRYQKINEPKFRSRWAGVVRSFPGSLNADIAKDRGVSLRALVIDVQVPQPDRDAGSYAAVQEMRLLQAMGLKLTLIPQNLAYLGTYTETLQRMGVECLYAPFQTSVEDVIETRGGEFDVFYITRYGVAEKYIATIRRVAPNAKIVFNNADLHFLREIRAAIASQNPDALPAAVRTRDAELAVMRDTDVTLSYTETEAAVILSHNLTSTKVARCPWVIEVASEVKPFSARTGLAFLGNYQHPPNEEAIRYFIREILSSLRVATPDLVLDIYGANMPDEIRKLAADGVRVKGYVEDVAEVYQNCRIFIAPLLSGAGIKGKVIGALAAGTPTIMTSLAAEGVGISRGAEAIVADGAAEWVAAVATLYEDEARWTEMSRRAIAFSRTHFSFEAGLSKMKAALALAGVYAG